uniref:Uncharacterized protein n=1 Tax=Globodera rostochiensis TaxID=31243 RepID=A0A914I5T5_GLORO
MSFSVIDKQSAESSFDEMPMPTAEMSGESDVSESLPLPLSRSTSSSSFTRRSWTDLKAETNISDEEDEHGKTPRHLDSDSTFGGFGCDFDDNESDEFKRNVAKLAIFGIIVAMVFGKFFYIWSADDSTNSDEMSGENGTKLRAELDRMVAEKWEFELKLVQLRDHLEAERILRGEVEKELWKAHERLETELDERIRLQTELGKNRAELLEAEQRATEAEKEADNKWMGGGFVQLNKLYRKAKETEWARGDLKETSEWWVPLYWRVVRVTFFKER